MADTEPVDLSTDALYQRIQHVGLAGGLSYVADGPLAGAGRLRHHGVEPVHTHSFVETVVVLDGTAVHHNPLGRHPIAAGDVLVLRPGSWHGYEECDELRIMNLCFSAELLRRELSWMRDDPITAYLLWDGPYAPQQRGTLAFTLKPDELEECVHHLDALHDLGPQSLARHRSDTIGRLALALGYLARAADRGRDRQPSSTDTHETHQIALQAIRLLEAQIDRDWSLTELAGVLHLTPNHLIRVFKAATGLPPMAYLARFRTESAAVLLLHTNDSIRHIAERVGWHDQNYFARRFKAHFGISPTAYRVSGIGQGR